MASKAELDQSFGIVMLRPAAVKRPAEIAPRVSVPNRGPSTEINHFPTRDDLYRAKLDPRRAKRRRLPQPTTNRN